MLAGTTEREGMRTATCEGCTKHLVYINPSNPHVYATISYQPRHLIFI